MSNSYRPRQKHPYFPYQQDKKEVEGITLPEYIFGAILLVLAVACFFYLIKWGIDTHHQLYPPVITEQAK